jgi:hypothetical protein
MRANVRFAGAFATFLLAAIASPARAQSGSEPAPGAMGFGTLTLSGPAGGAISNIAWVINDAGPSSTYPNAPGVAGAYPAVNGQVSGWSLLKAINTPPPVGPKFSGDFYWDATPSDQLEIHLITLLGPRSSPGHAALGPMADFDPGQSYNWTFATFQGAYKTHNTAEYPNGPPTDSATLDASTAFDIADDGFGPFANTHPGTFGWVFDGTDKELNLTYTPFSTPVPEPGTLGLVGIGALVVLRRAIRRRENK